MAALLVTLYSGVSLAWPGRLVDDTGKPLVGARITPIGESGGVISDADGRFECPLSAPVVLLIELPDGSSHVVELLDGPGAGERLVVTIDPRMFEEVRTTAHAAGALVAPPAAQAWTIGGDEVVDRQDASIQQALAQLPGTETPSPDPDDVPAIRGLGDNRTLFLLDDAAVGTERRAGVSGGGIHAATLGGIEVARGPGSLIYGSGAIGGVILVKSPFAAVGAERRITTRAEGRAGGAPGYSFSALFQEDGLGVAAGLRNASDPETADGEDLRGSYRQASVFTGKSWTRDGSLYRVGIRGDRLSDAYRPRPAAGSKQTLVPRDERLRLVLRAERPGDVERTLVGWWGQSERLIQQLRVLPTPTRGTDTRESEFGARAVWRATSGELRWTAGGELRGRYGVDAVLSVDDGGTGSPVTGSPVADGQQLSAAAFSMLRRPLGESFELAFGARLEPTRTRATSGRERVSSTDTAWAAHVSLMARTARLGSLTLQFARTYRQPSITDRYLEGITGQGFKLASPGLDAESAVQADLGWHFETGRYQVSAAVFHYDIDDVLVRDFLEDELYRFENAGFAEVRGVELGARVALTRSTTLQASLHAIRGERDDGAYLAGIPADGVTLGLRRDFARGAYVRGEIRLARADDRVGPGERALPGYGTVSVAAAHPLGRRLGLRVGIHNLFDKSHPISADEDDPNAPGRTYVLALDLRL